MQAKYLGAMLLGKVNEVDNKTFTLLIDQFTNRKAAYYLNPASIFLLKKETLMVKHFYRS